MEPEGSSLYSQESANVLYRQINESIRHPPNLFPWDLCSVDVQ
jgi:hypothetical protein